MNIAPFGVSVVMTCTLKFIMCDWLPTRMIWVSLMAVQLFYHVDFVNILMFIHYARILGITIAYYSLWLGIKSLIIWMTWVDHVDLSVRKLYASSIETLFELNGTSQTSVFIKPLIWIIWFSMKISGWTVILSSQAREHQLLEVFYVHLWDHNGTLIGHS